MEHILKIHKKEFEALLNGDLTFVIYKVDRIYTTGDRLILFEQDCGKETGRSLTVRITFICHAEDSDGIKDDYCAVSVKRSGKNTRTNSGNKPSNEAEAVEYAISIGRSEDCAKRFFNYYAMSGWKMKNGIPIADWKAALRNWKDYNSNAVKTEEQQKQSNQLELLLPLLLKKTAEIARQRHDLLFKDPAIGVVMEFYGFERFEFPFNAFEVKEMLKKYLTSKNIGTGCPRMKSPNIYGKGTLVVPTIEEYAQILQRNKDRHKN